MLFICTHLMLYFCFFIFFFFQAEDGIRDLTVTGVQTCALPIFSLDALKITRATGSGVGECAFCLRRRKTFSTSMMASSTNAPIAIARPPNVIVLTVIPK